MSDPVSNVLRPQVTLRSATRDVIALEGYSTPKLLAEDKDMLEDLIVAAINDAVHKLAARSQEKYAGLMSGLNLPPGMKLPF